MLLEAMATPTPPPRVYWDFLQDGGILGKGPFAVPLSFRAFAALFVSVCQDLGRYVLFKRENRSAVTCCHSLRFVRRSWETQGHLR